LSSSTAKKTGKLIAHSNLGPVSISSVGRLGQVISKNNSGNGVVLNNPVGEQVFSSIISHYNSSYGLSVTTQCFAKVEAFDTTGNSSGSVNAPISNNSYLCLHSPTYTEGTFVSSGSMTTGSNAMVRVHNENGVANSHRTFVDGGVIRSDTGADRHTLSGMAWKFSPTSTTRNTVYPLRLPLGPFEVENGDVVTVTIWVKRSSNTACGARLVVPAAQMGGIGTSDLVDDASAASNTYEQLSVNFTATEDGSFEVYLEAFTTSTSTTENIFFDDFDIAIS
jgi:hypothetical protein